MRAPVVLVLLGGLMTVGFGVFALILAWREDGLPQLLLPAVALGLVLVGWGILEARRPKPEFPPTGEAPSKSAGRWFPYALGAILVLQFAWLMYWRVSRR